MTGSSGSRSDRLPSDHPPVPARGRPRSARRARVAALAAAATTVGLLGTAGLPGTAAASGAAATAGAAPTAASRVTLVTGDVLTVRPGTSGATVGSAVHAVGSGPGRRLETVRDGRHTYVFPASAAPYLGRQLDRALFDLSTGRARADQHVVLTYRSGHHHGTVPGITATGGSGDTVTGTVTAPRTFGRALADQFAKDRAGGTDRAGAGGLFADVASIAPATGATPPAAHPDYPMHTLTINGIGADGKKADAFLGVWNMDDFRRYFGFPILDGGVAKVSVPAGHYAVVAQFFGAHNETYFVTLPSATVRKATSVTLDARTATSRLQASVPRKASLAETDAGLFPADARGSIGGISLSGDDSPVYYAPTKKAPATGDLYWISGFQFRSPASASPGYDYALRYGGRHTVPADQSFDARAGSLATVDATYSGDAGTQHGLDSVFGLFPWEGGGFVNAYDFATPTHRTNYYNSGKGLLWARDWTQRLDDETFSFFGNWSSTYRAYRPGQHLATTWAAQPLHPRLQQGPTFPGQTVCPGCRNGRTVALRVYPFGDNESDHYAGADDPAKGSTEKFHHTVTADKATVASGDGGFDGTFTMPKGAKTYGFTLDTNRRYPGVFELSDTTSTTWTVPASASAALPKGWYCNDENLTRTCRVMPLLTNSYRLPVDVRGTLPAGATKGALELGHLHGGAAKITTATVEVSYDGGKTWKKATVTGGAGGHYGLAFTVPAKGSTDGYGAVRLTAKDAAGSTLTQTVHRAFAVR